MTPKEYLGQIRRINTQIRQKEEQIAELQEQLVSISAPLNPDKVSTGASDKVSALVSRLVDLQSDLEAELFNLVAAKRSILDTVGRLEDPNHMELIYMRYVQCLTWKAISAEMGYSVQWVWRLHGQALLAVADLIKSRD